MLKREGVVARFQQLDVTCRDSINRCSDFLLAEHGGLDVLINNAAVLPEVLGLPLLNNKTSEYRRSSANVGCSPDPSNPV